MCREITEVAETIPNEVSVAPPQTTDPALYNGEFEEYTACYPYESAEVGDLIFSVGEHIKVIKKDGDWWTGMIGTRVGIFPSNYVQPAAEITAPDTGEYYTPTETTQNGNQYSSAVIEEVIQPVHQKQIHAISDEAKTQEEADTEVSEINTQPQSDNVQETYSRPMSTSTTPVNFITDS